MRITHINDQPLADEDQVQKILSELRNEKSKFEKCSALGVREPWRTITNFGNRMDLLVPVRNSIFLPKGAMN